MMTQYTVTKLIINTMFSQMTKWLHRQTYNFLYNYVCSHSDYPGNNTTQTHSSEDRIMASAYYSLHLLKYNTENDLPHHVNMYCVKHTLSLSMYLLCPIIPPYSFARSLPLPLHSYQTQSVCIELGTLL